MSLSSAVGASCLLLVLAACGGRSESDLAEGAKQIGIVDLSTDSLCAGRILANSGLSDETLDILVDAFDGSSNRPSVVFPKSDSDEFARAMEDIETKC